MRFFEDAFQFLVDLVDRVVQRVRTWWRERVRVFRNPNGWPSWGAWVINHKPGVTLNLTWGIRDVVVDLSKPRPLSDTWGDLDWAREIIQPGYLEDAWAEEHDAPPDPDDPDRPDERPTV